MNLFSLRIFLHVSYGFTRPSSTPPTYRIMWEHFVPRRLAPRNLQKASVTCCATQQREISILVARFELADFSFTHVTLCVKLVPK
jgi:hypothetical protein